MLSSNLSIVIMCLLFVYTPPLYRKYHMFPVTTDFMRNQSTLTKLVFAYTLSEDTQTLNMFYDPKLVYLCAFGKRYRD